MHFLYYLLCSVSTTPMLDLVNKARQQAGLPPLITDVALIQASEQHCAHQVAIDTMTHDDPNPPASRIQSAGYTGLQAWAENVAETPANDNDKVMSMWMSSPGKMHFSALGHRQNILGNYAQLGWAVQQGRKGNFYWTQMFARPFNSTKPPVKPVTVTQAVPQDAQVTLTRDAQATLTRDAQATLTRDAQGTIGETVKPEPGKGKKPEDCDDDDDDWGKKKRFWWNARR